MDSIGATQANFLPRPFVVPPPSVRRRSGPACLPVRPSVRPRAVEPGDGRVANGGGGDDGRRRQISGGGGGDVSEEEERSAQGARTVQLSKQMACAAAAPRRGAVGAAGASTPRVLLLFKFLLSFWDGNKVT